MKQRHDVANFNNYKVHTDLTTYWSVFCTPFYCDKNIHHHLEGRIEQILYTDMSLIGGLLTKHQLKNLVEFQSRLFSNGFPSTGPRVWLGAPCCGRHLLHWKVDGKPPAKERNFHQIGQQCRLFIDWADEGTMNSGNQSWRTEEGSWSGLPGYVQWEAATVQLLPTSSPGAIS